MTISVIFLSSFNSICRNGDKSFEAEHQAFFPSSLAKEAIVFLFKLEDAVIFLSGTLFPRSETQAPLKVKIIINTWVALGKVLEKFVYLAVEICHQETLPSATPSFPVGKKLCETEKHQRCRSAWVGQADFGKLELNNRNHGGKCQHLSAKRDQFETRSI